LNQSDSIKKMSVNLHDSEKDSEKWSLECQILKDQLALKETQLAKYMEEFKEAQCRICRFTEMNQKFGEADSSEAQLLILKDQVKNYENLYVQEQNDNSKINQQLAKLKEENGYFRGCMNKEMLLEEKNSSLESESRYLRNLLKSKTDIESERDSLKEQLNRWTVLAVNIDPEYTNTQKFKQFLGRTQGDLFEMKQENLTLGCKYVYIIII
jgi:DNA repair exonuclease SbcCD ATPase subunit